MLEKIKYKSNLTTSSDFAVTNRRMIVYTGLTFPFAIMSVFRTKRYMQRSRSLFWFLLTILSILSLTAFPLISVGSQISAAPPSYTRLTFKRSFYQKPVHYLTVNKTVVFWGSMVFISNFKMKIRKSRNVYLELLIPLTCIENVTSQ